LWIESIYGESAGDSNDSCRGARTCPSIADMATDTQSITLGPIRLEQRGGELLAHHVALVNPAQIDSMQLQRWLLKQLREQVVAVATSRAEAA